MLKRLLGSKMLRYGFSAALIFFAFRKVDIRHLLAEIVMVPRWFVVLMVLYFCLTLIIGAWRWSLLVLENPKFKDVMLFTRSTFLGSFYSIVFPTMVAGDLLKWLPLMNKYPELSKTKLAGSVLIDRVVGFTAFVTVGLLALLLGRANNYQFPELLLWLFTGLAFSVLMFYLLLMLIDFDKWFGKYHVLNKILEIVHLLKKENKYRLIQCYAISLLAEPFWMIPVWFYSQIFDAGFTVLQVFIFVPIISLILILPISIAGFGARENLFLFFFSQIGYSEEKILLVSTFAGIISVLGGLLGGLMLLIPGSRIDRKKLEEAL